MINSESDGIVSVSKMLAKLIPRFSSSRRASRFTVGNVATIWNNEFRGETKLVFAADNMSVAVILYNEKARSFYWRICRISCVQRAGKLKASSTYDDSEASVEQAQSKTARKGKDAQDMYRHLTNATVLDLSLFASVRFSHFQSLSLFRSTASDIFLFPILRRSRTETAASPQSARLKAHSQRCISVDSGISWSLMGPIREQQHQTFAMHTLQCRQSIRLDQQTRVQIYQIQLASSSIPSH